MGFEGLFGFTGFVGFTYTSSGSHHRRKLCQQPALVETRWRRPSGLVLI